MKKPTEGFEGSKEFNYDYLSTASSQDCTGLIPMKPEDDDAYKNYVELYPFMTLSPEELLDNDFL